MPAGMPTPPSDGLDAFASIREALAVLSAFVAIIRSQQPSPAAPVAVSEPTPATPTTTTGQEDVEVETIPAPSAAPEPAAAAAAPPVVTEESADVERYDFPVSPEQWFALRQLLWPPSQNDLLEAHLAQHRRRVAEAEAAAAGTEAAGEGAGGVGATAGTGVPAAAAVDAAQRRRRELEQDIALAASQHFDPPLRQTLRQLGAYVEGNLHLDYFLVPQPPTLTIRRRGALHGRLSFAVARLITTRLEEVLGLAEADKLWEQSEASIKFVGTDDVGGGFLVEETCPDAGIGYLCEASSDNDHYFPGIIVEISFSNNPVTSERIRDYVEKSEGSIRCVVSVIVEHRPSDQVRLENQPPVGVTLDVAHYVEDAESWGSANLVHQLDVRAAVVADPTARLDLSLAHLSSTLADQASVPVSISLAALLDAIDRQYGPSPSYPANIVGGGGGASGKRKRGRTPVPESLEGEAAGQSTEG